MRAVWVFPVFLTVLSGAGFAMSPPTRAVQISPGFALRGLGAVSAPGIGVNLSVTHSRRDELRSGTTDVPNPDQEETESTQSVLLFDITFVDRFSGLLSIPYIYTEASFRDPSTGATVNQDADGLGDIAVFGRYSIWRNLPWSPSREWFGIAGVELPTGSKDEKDDLGNPLAATQQPGSGATDFIVGTSIVWGWPRVSLYGDATLKIHGKRAYVFGDVFAVNVGAAVPFAREHWSVLGELNGEFAGVDESSFTGAPGRNPDGTVQNTGNETVYVSPALQWRPAVYTSFTAGVQIPVFQNFRGTQLKAELNYRVGATMRFY